MVQFKNKQLQKDIDKLLSYDYFIYSDITTDYDESLGFILDVRDNSYFYSNEMERDLDEILFMAFFKDKFLY